MSDQKLSKEPSDQDQSRSKPGAKPLNTHALKSGVYCDPEKDRLRRRSAQGNAAQKKRIQAHYDAILERYETWSPWKRKHGFDENPVVDAVIESIVLGQVKVTEVDEFLCRRRPDTALEQLRVFVSLLGRIIDDSTRLLKLEHGATFGDGDATPLNTLICASMELERERDASREDPDESKATGLEEDCVDLEDVESVQGEDETPRGGGVRIHGATPDDDAYPTQNSEQVSESRSESDNPDPKTKSRQPQIESGPTHATPVEQPRRTWRDNRNHPAIRWSHGEDL